MTRLEANRKIIEKIRKVVEAAPDCRFHQILQNMGITDSQEPDKWYEESEKTLARLSDQP